VMLRLQKFYLRATVEQQESCMMICIIN
jgi:hypothetical protein